MRFGGVSFHPFAADHHVKMQFPTYASRILALLPRTPLAPAIRVASKAQPVTPMLAQTLPPPCTADTFLQKTKKVYMDTRSNRNLSKMAGKYNATKKGISEVLGWVKEGMCCLHPHHQFYLVAVVGTMSDAPGEKEPAEKSEAQ